MVNRIGPAISVAAVILGWGGVAGAQNSKDCRYIKIAELPLKFEHNRPLVQVALNGRPAWFVIDTGADSSNMFGGAARTFGLSENTADGVKFYGIGGGQDAKLVIVSEFGLGAAKVKDVRLYSIGHAGSADFAGLLGRDFLGRLGDIEFDLAAGVLRFWKADRCGNRSLAYWTTTPAVAELRHDDIEAPYMVKMRINGKPVDAELDSGAGTTTITPGVANQAGVPPEKYESQVRYLHGIGEGKVAAQIATFDSVAVGEEEIRHTRLQVSDMFALNTEHHTGSILATHERMRDEPRMLLGADFLRSHRILIAASQHLLYFTYSGGPIFEVVGDAVKPKDAPQPAPTAPPTARTPAPVK
jgi:predicted aspartyl protease